MINKDWPVGLGMLLLSLVMIYNSFRWNDPLIYLGGGPVVIISVIMLLDEDFEVAPE